MNSKRSHLSIQDLGNSKKKVSSIESLKSAIFSDAHNRKQTNDDLLREEAIPI